MMDGILQDAGEVRGSEVTLSHIDTYVSLALNNLFFHLYIKEGYWWVATLINIHPSLSLRRVLSHCDLSFYVCLVLLLLLLNITVM